ncbi:hypothetical protein ACOMHN_029352 [Nucella lapillus]
MNLTVALRKWQTTGPDPPPPPPEPPSIAPHNLPTTTPTAPLRRLRHNATSPLGHLRRLRHNATSPLGHLRRLRHNATSPLGHLSTTGCRPPGIELRSIIIHSSREGDIRSRYTHMGRRQAMQGVRGLGSMGRTDTELLLLLLLSLLLLRYPATTTTTAPTTGPTPRMLGLRSDPRPGTRPLRGKVDTTMRPPRAHLRADTKGINHARRRTGAQRGVHKIAVRNQTRIGDPKPDQPILPSDPITSNKENHPPGSSSTPLTPATRIPQTTKDQRLEPTRPQAGQQTRVLPG